MARPLCAGTIAVLGRVVPTQVAVTTKANTSTIAFRTKTICAIYALAKLQGQLRHDTKRLSRDLDGRDERLNAGTCQLQRSLGGAVETHDPKSGGVVKRRKRRLVVHVEPFAAAIARECRRATDELQTDALPTAGDIDCWIQKKRVLSAIRGQIDISNESIRDECSQVPEATCEYGVVGAGNMIGPSPSKKVIERAIVEWWIDAILNCLGHRSAGIHLTP